MKIEFRKTVTNDTTLTLKQIRENAGVYAPVGYEDVRVIVNYGGKVFFVNDGGSLEVLALKNWQYDRFVKTNEEVVIRG